MGALFAVLAWFSQLLAPPPPVEAGERAFQRCLACHSVTPGEDGLTGPNLTGVVGRPAGSMPDYAYSPALLAAGQVGLVWTPETLDRFIQDPEAVVPGTTMPYLGAMPEQDRRVLVEWLGER